MNLLYVALTRAIESMTIIKKTKKSVFGQIGMSPLSVGSLENIRSPKKEETYKITSNEIEYYGVQDVKRVDDEEEKDYDAILFGLALHYTLEMMSSFTRISLAEAIMATKNRYGSELTEKQFEDIKNRIVSLITNERFKKLLKNAKIAKEQFLSFEEQFKQIDLLLEYKNFYTVLDYKTSKRYQFKHKSQVGYYKKAIYNITGKYTRGIIL